MTPEEWRDVPGWPGYQVSDRVRVRKVRLLSGGNLVLRCHGRQVTTTPGAMYRRAFNKHPLTQASVARVRKPGDLWQLIRRTLTGGPRTVEHLVHAVLKDDKDTYGLTRRDTRKFRVHLSQSLRSYVKAGWLTRPRRSVYQLTQLGEQTCLT